MASNNGKHAKGGEAKPATPAVTAVPASADSVEAAPSTSVEVAAPHMVLTAVATKTAPDRASGFGAAFDSSFDATKLSTRSFDIWNENTTAFFDFAEKLTKVKTIDEVADLQTRFISERVETLMRQSTELMTLAQKMMNVSVTPFFGAKAA